MPARTPLTGYQKKLFVFLGVATFFEGFDQMALAQLLGALGTEFHLDRSETGHLITVTNLGTVASYVIVRLADRWGRKPVLDLTIAGYMVASFLCGLAPNVWLFVVFQTFARMFLVGEWIVSTIYAAEEFPADRRGSTIGVIAAFAAVGAIVCAVLVPQLSRLPWGWRSVYFAGTVPLLLLAIARRGIKETDRWKNLTAAQRRRKPLLDVLRTPYRKRIFQLAAVWTCIHLCTQTAITFWKQHAMDDLHLEEGTVGAIIGGAAAVTMPLVFFAGRLFDRIGRRPGAVLVFSITSLGCVLAYTLSSIPALFVSVACIILGAAGMLPVLNALSTELFPTHLRSDAFAWSNNLLGRVGFVIFPSLVSTAAEEFGWTPAVAVTAVGPLVAAALVWTWFPETSGKELEETSALH